jgi:hypothetical protein
MGLHASPCKSTLRFGRSVHIREVCGSDCFELTTNGVGGEAGAEQRTIERGDLIVGDFAARELEFAVDAEADGGAFGVGVGAFGDGGFDVGVRNAAGTEVTRDAICPLPADLSALAGELFGVAGVVDHATFAQAGENDLCEQFAGGTALEEFLHLGDRVRAAHQGALGSFIKLGFGFELAGFAEHKRRIEEIEGISHSGTEAWSSESEKDKDRGRFELRARDVPKRTGIRRVFA